MDDEILDEEFEHKIQYVPSNKSDKEKHEIIKEKIDKKNIGPVVFYPTESRRHRALIVVLIVLILLLWTATALILIFGEEKFYNAKAITHGNGTVEWYIEGKSTTKFLTCEDIVAGAIYNIDISVKNYGKNPTSFRVKINMTCNGEAMTSYNLVGIDNSRFTYENGWYTYQNSTDNLLASDSGQRFATGIKLGNQFPDLNYRTFRLELIMEAYKGAHAWE